MKKIILILTAIAVISCQQKENKSVDYAIFSGSITNSNSGVLKVSSSEKVINEINLNSDGTFKDTLRNITTGYYNFKFGNESSKLYLEPGFELNLQLNPSEFDESITYTGIGADENNYLAKKIVNQEKLAAISSYKHLGSLDENQYIKTVDSLKLLAEDFLTSQNLKNKYFINLEQADIHYGWINNLSRFELYKRFISKNPKFKKSDNFPEIASQVDLENEDLMKVNNYRTFVASHYQEIATDLAKNDSIEADIALLKTIVKDVKSPVIKENLLYNNAKYGITYTKELQNYYDIFMANSTNDEHKKDITEKYNKRQKLSKGADSPSFKDYENYAGGTSSLEDFRGKYVYVDVWATWCGPCKREIPHLKEVEKKYHDKDIVFISMSIDAAKDHDKWKKMVKEEELGGVQLFAPNDWKSQFVKDYGILGIPRFILIDPDGKIVDSNAPRPSSKELINLFTELNI